MEISIDENNNVIIKSSGIELLKLTSQIYQRIGSILNSGKGFISMPLSALHLVEDIFNIENFNQSIQNALNEFKLHEIARGIVLKIITGDIEVSLPTFWRGVLETAQASAVKAMVTPNLLGLCLFDEQGSGKTVMSIAAFDLLKDKGEIDSMIIVCPKSMLGEWPKDIQKFLGKKYKIVITNDNKRQKYESSISNFDILVTNYEGVKTMLVALRANALIHRYLLVIDESYYLKNYGSQRSAIVTKLRNRCKRCFVLCGTPAPNTAYDLVNQFNLADMEYTFGGFKKSNIPSDDWGKITSLVESRGVFIRRLKEDILTHVPEKKFHILRVELSGKQAAIYEKARCALEMELRTFNNETFKKRLTTYFQKRAALLQICSCPAAIDPTISEPPAKYVVLDKLLEDLISQGRKVVLWSFYTKSLDDIQDRYLKYNPVRIDGSIISREKRVDAVQSFQENSSTMLFIGNPAAAGAGITLHAAYDAVYLSYSNQAAHYLQSLDRIHRRGQISNEVNYYLLICRGTIEESEVIRLRRKELQQHNILNDHIQWPTSLDDALTELDAHA